MPHFYTRLIGIYHNFNGKFFKVKMAKKTKKTAKKKSAKKVISKKKNVCEFC